MKWGLFILLALLTVGVMSSVESVDQTSDLAPTAPLRKWKTTFYPAGSNKILKRPFSLGSSTTFAQFRETLAASSAQKAQAWEEIYKRKDDPFVVKLFRNGITHFSHSASLQADEGVEKKDLDAYCNHVVDRLGVPQEARPELIKEIKLASMAENAQTQIISAVFPSGAQGHGRFVTIMAAKDYETKEYDFVIINIMATFEIGPDIIAVTVNHSALWGLIRWQEIKYIKRAAEISQETVGLVFDFFKFAAFDKFKEFLK